MSVHSQNFTHDYIGRQSNRSFDNINGGSEWKVLVHSRKVSFHRYNKNEPGYRKSYPLSFLHALSKVYGIDWKILEKKFINSTLILTKASLYVRRSIVYQGTLCKKVHCIRTFGKCRWDTQFVPTTEFDKTKTGKPVSSVCLNPFRQFPVLRPFLTPVMTSVSHD